jgi:hypothetical protein
LNFDRVAFDNNWNSLSVKYAQGGTNPVSLTVHVDSLDNAPVATLNLAPTGGWNTLQTVSIPWAPLSGEHKLFVRFGGGANVDSFQFSAPSGLGANLVANSDFEVDSATGWSSWGGGTIATSTARALSGNSSLAMTGRNGNSPLVYNLSVTPGKTYKASLWASIGGTASAQANVTTSVQCADGSGPGFTWLGSAQTITDGQWVEFTGDLVIPDCPLGWIAFWLEGPGAGVDLYLDHVSVRPVTQTTTNVVANGTFESGTTGWGTWNSGVLTASTARAHSGTRSLLVSDRASNAPAAIDLTSVVSRGRNYPVSIWAAIDSADNASQAINVTRMVECDGTPSYSWLTQATIADNGQWVELTGTLDVTDCNVTKVLLWVEGGTADLYLDDVRVVVAAAPANLITDGTFEAGQGGWFGWGNAGLGVVNTSAHAGTQSLKGTSMTSGAIARDIRSLVTAGMRYQATAWVSVDSLAAGSGAVRFQTAAACNGGGTSYPWLMGVTVANGAWQQVTGVVDLSACTSVEQLQLFVGADEGDLYVDDVTLTLIP